MTPMGSRTFALGLLSVILVALYLVVLEPFYVTYQSNVESLAEHRFDIERLRAIAPRVEQAEAELAALSTAQRELGLTVAYQSPGVALAAMQERFRALAKQSNAGVISIGNARSAPVEGLQTIAIRAHVQASLPAVQKLLHVIESTKPIALIRDLTLMRLRKRGDGDAAGSLLDARMVVVTVMESDSA
jgi:hypothetical protein